MSSDIFKVDLFFSRFLNAHKVFSLQMKPNQCEDTLDCAYEAEKATRENISCLCIEASKYYKNVRS